MQLQKILVTSISQSHKEYREIKKTIMEDRGEKTKGRGKKIYDLKDRVKKLSSPSLHTYYSLVTMRL